MEKVKCLKCKKEEFLKKIDENKKEKKEKFECKYCNFKFWKNN